MTHHERGGSGTKSAISQHKIRQHHASTTSVSTRKASSKMDSMPERTWDLAYFTPLVAWIIEITIHERLSTLGVKCPVWGGVEWIFTNHNLSPVSYPKPSDAELELIKHVVEEVGWLTWNDYLHLVVAWRCRGPKSMPALLLWTDNGNLDKYFGFLKLLMRNKVKLRPFKPVFEKAIQRYLLEVEMRKKYRSIMGKRYEDFWTFGRSLNFGWKDIELESKELAFSNTCKDGKDNISERHKDEKLQE